MLHNRCSEILLAPILMNEIKNIIFNANDDKSPGSDGFGAKFFKMHWHDIKNMMYDAVNEFFLSGNFLKNLNHTFITLLSKIKVPNSLSDYRPIA